MDVHRKSTGSAISWTSRKSTSRARDGRQLRDQKGKKRHFMGYQLQHVNKVQKAKGQE
jgi:hypothetical protein